jgi:hypothetical protein
VRWLRLRGADVAPVSFADLPPGDRPKADAGKSAISRARLRLGTAPLKEPFARVARPLAEPGLPGALRRLPAASPSGIGSMVA